MRDRLLVRLFLWRFLEHDLVSPNVDRHTVMSAVGGALAAFSLFVAVLMAWQYQLAAEMPPGITAVFALSDRFLFTSSSMLVMALAAAVQWDALVLDSRDAAVLGPLPLTRGVIVRAKFVATGLLAAGVLALWNLFPTLLRGAMIPSGLGLGMPDAFKLTLAHALVTSAAGLFGFLAVLGLRESLFAVLGAAGFRRVSAVVQTSLIFALTTSLLLLPRVNSVASEWHAQEPVPAKALPPAWFVGLHERLVGGVFDSLPRGRPARYLVRREREATELYRSLWPLYRQLALIAIFAWCFVALVTTTACVWNSRRLPSTMSSIPRDTALTRVGRWFAVHLLARAPVQQAGFFFALQTLSRRVAHRAGMAAAWAIGLALIVVDASGDRSSAASGTIPIAVLMAQPLLLGIVMNGFRRATRLPSELRGSSTFTLAWSGGASAFVSGVKRAGWIAVVAPALFGLAIWHTAILGPRLAALHFGVGFATSAVLMEIIFLRCREVPFVTAAPPTVDVKLRLIGFLVALVSLSSGLAWIERLSFGGATGYVSLVVFLVVLSLATAIVDRVSRSAAVTFDGEEELFPTQRLNLTQ